MSHGPKYPLPLPGTIRLLASLLDLGHVKKRIGPNLQWLMSRDNQEMGGPRLGFHVRTGCYSLQFHGLSVSFSRRFYLRLVTYGGKTEELISLLFVSNLATSMQSRTKCG